MSEIESNQDPDPQPEIVKSKITDNLLSYMTISLLIGLACIILFLTDNPNHSIFGRGTFLIDKHHTTDLKIVQLDSLSPKKLELIKERYLDIYTTRKAHYEKSSSALSTIVNGLGVCCLISVLALYYERKDSISIAGISIPFKSVFLILPILMLYLWLSFGFTLFSAWDSRQVCYVSSVKYESISDRLDSSEMCVSRDFRMYNNLEDMGIIDGSVHFFNGFYSDTVYKHFYAHEELKNNHGCKEEAETSDPIRLPVDKTFSPVVAISLFAIFGTLLGLSIGFILTLLISFQNLKNTHTGYARCLVILVFTLICLSFAGFCYHRPYFVLFVGYIWLVAALVLYFYVVRLGKTAR